MGIFDIFRKKPSSAKATEGKKVEARPLPKIKPKKRVSTTAYQVLVSPHITEKSTELGEKNKYVFKVSQRTNKIEIKKAIEDLYGVNVIDVKIINIHRKKRRIGRRREGWKKGYKKAIVKVEKGQKIEIMPR